LIDKKNEIKSKMHQRYIQSKIKAENVLKEYNSFTRNKVYIYRLPHVMGKWAKPNYNSVIATFCYNIANGKKVIISKSQFRNKGRSSIQKAAVDKSLELILKLL